MKEKKYTKPKELYTWEMVDYRLDSSREAIPQYARIPLAKSLTLLPKEIIDFIIENCVFISLGKDVDGQFWALDNILLKDVKGFVILNNNLWKKPPMKIAFTIAHEAAHAFKGHTFKGCEDIYSDDDFKIEEEADKLAVRWLSKHYKRESLLKLCNYISKK